MSNKTNDKDLPPLPTKTIDETDFRRMNRRRLLTGAGLGLLGLYGLRRLFLADDDRGMNGVLRKAMTATDSFWQGTFSNERRAAKTDPATGAPRINGDIGIQPAIASDWKLRVSWPGQAAPAEFSLEQIRALPAITESFEFKCIEGWSRDVTCTGVRFADFARSLGLEPSFDWAGLKTIDGEYFVSMDRRSLWHPQTLLCYEMNGETLKIDNGYPLRLMTPVKYGVKNIKQIGTIAFANARPPDYWAEEGYGDDLGL